MRTCAAFVNANFPQQASNLIPKSMLSWQAAPQNFFFHSASLEFSLPNRAYKNCGERSVVVSLTVHLRRDRSSAFRAFSMGRTFDRRDFPIKAAREFFLRERLLSRTKSEATRPNASPSRVEPPSPAATQRSAPGEAPGGSAGSVREDARAGVGPRRDGSRASVESRGGALAARRRRAVSETSESRVRVSRRWPPR